MSEYQGRRYEPCVPCGDSETLCERGDRLMAHHGGASDPEFKVFVAPKGVIHAGWVLGIFEENEP